VPLRVVVPSAIAREHALAALLASSGGALLGVRVQTLFSLALEIVEAAGGTVRASRLAFEVVARREAAAEPAPAPALSAVDDGFAWAAASMSDLLSAGASAVDATRAEAALERLESQAERERAVALLRAARRARDVLERAGSLRHPDVYARAA